MRLKLLLFVLLVCLQNTSGSKKKQKKGKNRLLSLGMGLLYLNCAFVSECAWYGSKTEKPATEKNEGIVVPLCPTKVPSFSLDMMNYIRCGEPEQTSEFFEKYLTTAGKEDLQKCKIISSLYQKAKKLGECTAENLTSIVKGAQQRLAGNTLTHAEELEMFEEYLQNADGLETDVVVSLSKAFQKNEKCQFFQIKNAADILVKHTNINIGVAFTEVLKPERQSLDFEKVDRMMPYAKMIEPLYPKAGALPQVYEALKPEYQKVDFQKVDKLYKVLQNHMKMSAADTIKEVLKQEHHGLDLEKVAQMLPHAKKLNLQESDQVKEALKPKYQKIDFGKVERMMLYAKLLHSSEHKQVEEALKPEYQALNFDVVDGMMIYTKKMNFGYDNSIWTLYGRFHYFGSDKIEEAKEALKIKYQKYDMGLVKTVYDNLATMAPKSPDFALEKALEPWIHNETSKNISKMLNLCKNAKDEESKKKSWILFEQSTKYQKYNMDIVTTVYDGLVAMAPGRPNFALEEALEPWIQKESFENISKMLNLCKNAKKEQEKRKNKKTKEQIIESAKRCWILKANKKKSDL